MNETFQTIIQLILTPTLIVGVLAFMMRELFKGYLSMDVERYKVELQNDLESHKAKLKAEYDVRQFEFQTRFSLLHQERAKIIQELYELLILVEGDFLLFEDLYAGNTVENTHLKLLSNMKLLTQKKHSIFGNFGENLLSSEEKFNFFQNFMDNYRSLYEFYRKKRIYLDEDICHSLDNICKLLEEPLNYYVLVITTEKQFAGTHFMEKAKKAMESAKSFNGDEISSTIKLTESRFRQFISAENPSQKIEKYNA